MSPKRRKGDNHSFEILKGYSSEIHQVLKTKKRKEKKKIVKYHQAVLNDQEMTNMVN